MVRQSALLGRKSKYNRMRKVDLHKVEGVCRKVSENGVMQSDGIGRIKGNRHMGPT